jgi:AcrR family transcriptional regulator
MDRAPLAAAPDRRSRRRSEIHERIFRAALTLFAQRGIAGTTVEQITELADVGKGTFFNYFPSKEHVFLALGEIQLGNVEAALEDALRGDERIPNVILHLARALTREPGRSPELLRSLLTAIFTSAAVRDVFVPVLTRGREMVARILEIARERGELREDLNPALDARLFQQTMLGTMAFWATHPQLQLNQLVEDAVGLYLEGLGARGTGKTRKEGSRR